MAPREALQEAGVIWDPIPASVWHRFVAPRGLAGGGVIWDPIPARVWHRFVAPREALQEAGVIWNPIPYVASELVKLNNKVCTV